MTRKFHKTDQVTTRIPNCSSGGSSAVFVHKRTISDCVKDAAGRVHMEGKIGSTRRELDAWIKTLPQPRMIAMEATIFTGWIYDHLLPHAEKVKVAHPLMLRAIAAAKRKNDKIDAGKIADCLRCDFLPECHMASTEIRDRRRTLRYRGLLVKQMVQMKNRISGPSDYPLTWVLEIGDVARFPSIKNAISYCGLCGAEKRSADKVVPTPISKQRNKHIQQVLVEAAKLAPRYSHELSLIYEKEKQRGNRNRATLAVARKMVAWMVAVERRKQDFVPAEDRGGTVPA
jgi:transposase